MPATSKWTDNIYTVGMAEFLMWTGKTLDTSKVENRRHFISEPDKNSFLHPLNGSPLFIPAQKLPYGPLPHTWEPGATDPAYAPPLFDPSAWPTGVKGLGTAYLDFTKCQFNWQMGRNIGTSKSKVERVGRVKADYPDPKVHAGS